MKIARKTIDLTRAIEPERMSRRNLKSMPRHIANRGPRTDLQRSRNGIC